jgi:very-short-patch-repair endonuclease
MLHFSKRPGHGHDMMFTEEVKNEGKEDVVCLGYEKPVFGPGYKCSTSSQCNFALHQSCVELPPEIQQHPFHPNHTLVLAEEPQEKYCNACGKNCDAYPFYCCRECNFNLDFVCATRPQIINIDDCQHASKSFYNHIQFTCHACGEEGKGLSSRCSICQLLIHGECARFPRTIWITSHDHSLSLTYSLRQVKEHNNVFCKFCYENVKTEYAAYYCQECDYVAHLACAFEYKIGAHLAWLPEKSIDLATNVTEEVEGAEKIQHFSHRHDLILSNEEHVEDILCDGCLGLISHPFYNCSPCNFFLHSRCAQLPRKKGLFLFHQHQLTLFSHAPYNNGLFNCDVCNRISNGFAYRCDICNFDVDLQCCSISKILEHKGHQHSLFLAVNSNRRCNVCNYTSNRKPSIFVCSNCDFALGLECATLPLVARHKYDDHLLELTCSVETHCEEYYCLICEKERDPKCWFYYCTECNFPAHPQCVFGKYPYIKFEKYASRFEGEHQHPLTFVPKTESSPPCDACGKTFNVLALECTQCKFNVHHSDSCVETITKKVTSK